MWLTFEGLFGFVSPRIHGIMHALTSYSLPSLLSSGLAPNNICTNQTQHEHHSNNSYQGDDLSNLIEESRTCVCACVHAFPTFHTQQDDHYRYLPDRLGRSHGQSHGTGYLYALRDQNVHQFSTTLRSLRSLQSLAKLFYHSSSFTMYSWWTT